MHSPEQIDAQGVYGTLMSVYCLIIAHVFETISMLAGLQMTAYIMTILIAVDTLLGNRLKQWINTRLKKIFPSKRRNKSNETNG